MASVAFFHGLESKSVSSKSEYLKLFSPDAYCPAMYYRDNTFLQNQIDFIQHNHFDLLIGSSMGGWFALVLSSLTGIPTLTFNPAIHSRTFEPALKYGDMLSNHIVVLGKNDDLINPEITVEMIQNKELVGNFQVFFEGNGHRTPIEIFKKYISFEQLNFKS